MTEVAILIPALNEEQTIASVVHAFRDVYPEARIIVFDNASTDATAARAREAGAEVRFEPRRGKGNVVQSMFRSIDADVYVMVDGDATYPAERIHDLVRPVIHGEADMVIGSRLLRGNSSDFRPLNRIGNLFYAALLRRLFGVRITDLLSGYRAFSRRLVKTLPLRGGGFETEAEMTIQAVHRGFHVTEVPVTLVARPNGSSSKIRIVQDGLLILNAIVALFRDYKPLTFFSVLSLLLSALAGMAWLSGLVVTAATLALFGGAAAATGAILHTVARRFQELETQLQQAGLGMRGQSRRFDSGGSVAALQMLRSQKWPQSITRKSPSPSRAPRSSIASLSPSRPASASRTSAEAAQARPPR